MKIGSMHAEAVRQPAHREETIKTSMAAFAICSFVRAPLYCRGMGHNQSDGRRTAAIHATPVSKYGENYYLRVTCGLCHKASDIPLSTFPRLSGARLATVGDVLIRLRCSRCRGRPAIVSLIETERRERMLAVILGPGSH
jgi:hypothetical protein